MGQNPVQSINTTEYDVLLAMLKEARTEAKMSRHALSQLIGEGRNFVAKIEDKSRRMDVVEFVKVARALGLNPVKVLEHFVQETGL